MLEEGNYLHICIEKGSRTLEGAHFWWGFQGGIYAAAEHMLDLYMDYGPFHANSECFLPGLLSNGSCEPMSTLSLG